MFFFLCPASVPRVGNCMFHIPVEKASDVYPPALVSYLLLSVRRETWWQPFQTTGSVSSALLPRSSGFSLFPFQAYSSKYLPVLSKCYCKVFQWDDSKYVYINRGNTLGYILLNPGVMWSVYHSVAAYPEHLNQLTWSCSVQQVEFYIMCKKSFFSERKS